MKLIIKSLLVVGISMSVFLVLLTIVFHPFLLEDSIELDNRNALTDIDSVNHYILSNMESLNLTNRDWAVWDDTFLFINKNKPEYVSVNLQNDTFENNLINFMVYFNNHNEMVFQKGYDYQERKPLELNRDFNQVFLPIIQSVDDVNESKLVQTPIGLTMSSIQTVYKSNGEGPAAGTLIMGRIINENYINKIGEGLTLPITIQPINDKSYRDKPTVHTISDTKIKASLYLQDFSKQHTYEIGLIGNRNYFLQKKVTVFQRTGHIILFSIFFIVLIIILLNRYILSRIKNLSHQLHHIQIRRDLKSRVSLSNGSKDELTNLAGSINKMLSSLEGKHNEIKNLAYYDQLTLIPNRYLFFKESKKKIRQNSGKKAILFFDLDGFKRVNDSLGHKIGDELLKKVCQRVLPIIKKHDGVMARYGGDEFIAFIHFMEKEEIETIAKEILSEVGKEYEIPPFKTYVTTSLGISIYPNDGDSIEQLLQNADIAMFESKRKGKNQYFFFHDLSSDNSYKKFLELENDLKYVQLKGQLELYYQSIVNGENKKVVGVEALLRWKHPTKGMISPANFIPIAEEIGLMPRIGIWVLEEAVRQVKKWHEEGFSDLSLSINISKSQMKDRVFIDILDHVLQKYQFPPSKLQIEITESDIHNYQNEVLEFSNELKKRNVKIALDDFGVGTSALLYIKELPLDVIKIDQNFIKNVPIQPFDTILLSGILTIIKDLNLEIVVEGIESKEQSDYITSRTFAYLQGYFFSRPVPVGTIEKEFLSNLKK